MRLPPPRGVRPDDAEIEEFFAAELSAATRWRLRADIVHVVARRHEVGSAAQQQLLAMAIRFETEAAVTERALATIH